MENKEDGEKTNRLACAMCGEPAVFMTPDGLLCDTHTLEAVEADDRDPDWIPVPIRRRPQFRARSKPS